MTACNATLYEFECNDHTEGAPLPHRNRRNGAVVAWGDHSEGATPHQDPTPTYRAWTNNRGSGVVQDAAGRWVAMFEADRHPDPHEAAEAHAEFLNGGGGLELAAQVVLQRMHAAERERDEARAEAARYRKALEKILHRKADVGGIVLHENCSVLARRVLGGGDA